MLYTGTEEYIYVKDNPEDMQQYSTLNIQQLQTEGWELSENDVFYILRRKMKLRRMLPVMEAEYTEKILEDENEL